MKQVSLNPTSGLDWQARVCVFGHTARWPFSCAPVDRTKRREPRSPAWVPSGLAACMCPSKISTGCLGASNRMKTHWCSINICLNIAFLVLRLGDFVGASSAFSYVAQNSNIIKILARGAQSAAPEAGLHLVQNKPLL